MWLQLYNQTGKNQALFDELLQGLNSNYKFAQYTDFRRLLREKVTLFISQKTGEARQENLQKFLELALKIDSKSKGEFFSAFRRETQGINFERISESERDLRLYDPNLKTVKNAKSADDAVQVKINIEDGPPAGKYLVEDKAGANAFDETQARNYSSSIEQGGGRIKTMDGQVYDGLIYFFDTEASANKAMQTIKTLNKNIYVGYYDVQGQIRWKIRQ